MNDDLTARGAKVMADLLPDGNYKKGIRDPVTSPFTDHVQVAVFGALWSRPGLDYRTRCLICVVSDISTGRFPELEAHARMALQQGWTRDELIEVALHLQAYVGAPLAREAIMTLRDVFVEVPE
jgi:4-carboxymuconolactone decarboxylase